MPALPAVFLADMIELTIPAADGFPLAAELRGAASGKRLLLIAPATGVRKTYYRAIAEFFAERGFAVLTWDWRGLGASQPQPGSMLRVGMHEWAHADMAGIRLWAAREWAGRPKVGIGHSFGGQSFGFGGDFEGLDGLVTVAAQNGYWGHWTGPRKLVYAGLWNVFLPAVTRTLGRFPAFFLGGGEDLPREVALDWARWCRNPDYFGNDTGHPDFAAPILSLSFSDDPYAPLPAVEALLDRYGSPSKEIRHLEPAKVNLPAIGHFGFFRPKAAHLWQDIASWLESR